MKRTAIIALIAGVAGIWLGWMARDFMAVDDCLDAGGAWDNGHCVGLSG